MLILTTEFLYRIALLPKSYHMWVGITVTNQDMHVSSRNLGWPSFRKLSKAQQEMGNTKLVHWAS